MRLLRTGKELEEYFKNFCFETCPVATFLKNKKGKFWILSLSTLLETFFIVQTILIQDLRPHFLIKAQRSSLGAKLLRHISNLSPCRSLRTTFYMKFFKEKLPFLKIASNKLQKTQFFSL